MARDSTAEARTKAKPKQGRPSDFTQKVADLICEKIATTARGLDFICDSDPRLPHASTVHRWLSTHPDFRESYLRARERQADLLFDQCLPIADDSSEDIVTDTREDGSTFERFDAERVARAKLRVDTRMRMAGKLAPKKYGDKVALVGGDAAAGDAPIQTVTKIVREIVDPQHQDRASVRAAAGAGKV